jgi:RNA polymerase sigma factor FliA
VRAYAKNVAPDPARDRLVAEHVDMARRIALRVARRVPEWMSQDDLIAAAMVGLAEAAVRYDAARGEPFVAFAEKRIRGAVLDELRKGDLMPRRVRQTARKVGRIQRELEHKHGRAAEDDEVAEAMGVSLEAYQHDLEMLTHVSVVELSHARETAASSEAGELALPSVEVERRQLVEHLHAALERLPERDAQILALYYMEEFSYAEIGQVLGVSESRVCQLHSRALTRLRAEMEAEDE